MSIQSFAVHSAAKFFGAYSNVWGSTIGTVCLDDIDDLTGGAFDGFDGFDGFDTGPAAATRFDGGFDGI